MFDTLFGTPSFDFKSLKYAGLKHTDPNVNKKKLKGLNEMDHTSSGKTILANNYVESKLSYSATRIKTKMLFPIQFPKGPFAFHIYLEWLVLYIA